MRSQDMVLWNEAADCTALWNPMAEAVESSPNKQLLVPFLHPIRYPTEPRLKCGGKRSHWPWANESVTRLQNSRYHLQAENGACSQQGRSKFIIFCGLASVSNFHRILLIQFLLVTTTPGMLLSLCWRDTRHKRWHGRRRKVLRDLIWAAGARDLFQFSHDQGLSLCFVRIHLIAQFTFIAKSGQTENRFLFHWTRSTKVHVECAR